MSSAGKLMNSSDNRKVYILGAGFSKAFDLPVANELLKQLVKDCDNILFVHKVNSTCTNFFPSFRDAFANYPNVEDFFNYYYSLVNYYSLFGPGPNDYVVSFISEFLFEVSKFLSKRIQSIDNKKENYLQYFLKGLNPGDVIITFNWDNLIETFLDKYRIPYSFNFSPSSQKILLLKLHGSIDWIRTKRSSEQLLSFSKLYDYKDKGENWGVYREPGVRHYEVIKELKESPFFIPPIAYKDESIKPLASLWEQAYNILRVYKNKIYIGYSLPKEDTMARVLFSTYRPFALMDEDKTILEEKIIVINPDEDVERHFKKYCADSFDFWQLTFERFADVDKENKMLKMELSPYKDALIRAEDDKFVQQAAFRVFDKGLYLIDALEKLRIKEYIKENFNVEIDIKLNYL